MDIDGSASISVRRDAPERFTFEEYAPAETHKVPKLAAVTPYDVFNKALGRAEGLLLLHPVLCAIGGRPRRHAGDLLRGTLVLSVGALDALVLESVVAAIPRAERDGTLMRSVAKWVKEDAEGSLALLGDRQASAKAAELCRRRLGQPRLERAAAIEDVIRDMARRDPPWPRAAEILSSDGRAWDAAAVKHQLDQIVEREHAIAYGGDLLPDSTSRRIPQPYVQEAVGVIRAVGTAVAETLT